MNEKKQTLINGWPRDLGLIALGMGLAAIIFMATVYLTNIKG